MTLPVYPGPSLLPGLTYRSKWSPSFVNMPTATTASGADIDLGLAQYPLHDFELNYAFLRSTPTQLEFQTLMGFHLQMAGELGRFLFSNPDDFQVTANQIGTGDGTTTVFPITRTFGANGYTATEPVGQVDTGSTLNVYVNDVLQPPSSYTISTASPLLNTVTFNTAPLAGKPITVDMSYFYYCKLHDNSNTFEKFMNNLFMLQKVTLHSCRAGA